jgi:transcriptional regulator with XRE-family HTH domain
LKLLVRTGVFVGADDDVPFGVLLRRYRYVARLTQEELAAKSGLSIRAVGDMERGRTGRPYRSPVAAGER